MCFDKTSAFKIFIESYQLSIVYSITTSFLSNCTSLNLTEKLVVMFYLKIHHSRNGKNTDQYTSIWNCFLYRYSLVVMFTFVKRSFYRQIQIFLAMIKIPQREVKQYVKTGRNYCSTYSLWMMMNIITCLISQNHAVKLVLTTVSQL